MFFCYLWSKSDGLPPKKVQKVSKDWDIVCHTKKELPTTATVNILILTSSGQPNIEKGNKPEENHVSNTSSSVKGKMAHQNVVISIISHAESHFTHFHRLYNTVSKQKTKQQKQRKSRTGGDSFVITFRSRREQSRHRSTEGKERKYNTLCFTFPSVFPNILQSLATHPLFLISNFLLNSSSRFQCTLLQSNLLRSYIESFCCLL